MIKNRVTREMRIIVLLVLTIFTLTAGLANAESPEYALSKYPKWIQDECIQLTKERTRVSYRISYPDALQCAELSMEKIREEELRQSVIEANNAAAELDRELVKEIRSR